jgi:heme oxygenase
MSPVLFSLYVNDMPLHSRQVELASYADKMAILATSRQPALLDSFLASYLGDLSGG